MKVYMEWQARAVRKNGPTQWFPAEVPGNVQYDYGKMLGCGDISVADNVTKFRETEDYTWEYRTWLSFEERPDEKAVFVSEGIDYRFDILIDGQKVMEHEGMFSRVELDVTGRSGQEMVIRIHPHPKSELAKYEDRDQANQSVKPPVCYEWDWHPRMLVSGLWQEAYIELRSADYIGRCEPFYTLSDDFSRAELHFEVECAAEPEITLYDPEGNVAGSGKNMTIENPKLWWCNGQGEPNLYKYVAKTEGHEVSGFIGFKKARLIMSEGAWVEPVKFPKGRSVAPIQMELNGRRVFCKGSNWVNPDIYNGKIDEKRYEQLITLAKDANMNIFRCWGGSGINKKAFYEICDRLGIMVWVEFPLACTNYVGTEKYLKVLEQEATAIIKKLRSHASIVLWCGGNELFNNWSRMTDQSLALRLLNSLCYQLDKHTPFIMTSPIFGMGHGGYTFWDPDQECDVFQLFQKSDCTAYTEFGVPGMPDVDYLRQFIPENELFPMKKDGVWKLHHAFGAWGEERWACLDVLERYAQEPLDSIDKVVEMSQWLQVEGYKAIFEEARRQAPYCSMAINWCYCEPWKTAANNSLIAYPIVPKKAYYAVQSALRPTMPSARIPKFDWRAGEKFTAEMWLLNDAPDAAEEVVSAEIELGGRNYKMLTWESGEVGANENRVGPAINWVLPDVAASKMTLTLKTKSGKTSTYTLSYRPKQAKKVTRQLNV